MKVNFKKIITAIAATAMCAVPMAGAMSANAASSDTLILAEQATFQKAAVQNIAEFKSEAKLSKGWQHSSEYVGILDSASFSRITDGEEGWCGNEPKPFPVPDDDPWIIVIIPRPRPSGPAGPCFYKELGEFRRTN